MTTTLSARVDDGGRFRIAFVPDRAGRWLVRASTNRRPGVSAARSNRCGFRAAPNPVRGSADLVVVDLKDSAVTVANIGRREAIGPFAVAIRRNGRTTRIEGFQGLRPGRRATAGFDCLTGKVTAVADPDGRIAERLESNNTARRTVLACGEHEVDEHP
jgi:hypothetical protein